MVFVYTMGVGIPGTLHYSVIADISKDTGIPTVDIGEHLVDLHPVDEIAEVLQSTAMVLCSYLVSWRISHDESFTDREAVCSNAQQSPEHGLPQQA